MFVVGIVQENTNSSVDVMRVEKAPAETYADIGGLDEQIIEIELRSLRARLTERGLDLNLTPAAVDALAQAGKELGLQIRIQRSEIFDAMHRI